MKNLVKLSLVAAVLTVTFSACSGGVDKKRLAELTGDKNFKQVEQAWKMSVLQEKPKDQKIYAYWLKENGEKASATFDFDNFKTGFMTKYNDGLKKAKNEMAQIKSGVDKMVANIKKNNNYNDGWNMIRSLNTQKDMVSFQAGSSAFIRKVYYPFLQKQVDRITTAQDEAKKAEKAEMERKFQANLKKQEKGLL